MRLRDADIVNVVTIEVGTVQLTRAGYADIGVDADRVGLTHEQVASASWAEPTWAQDGHLRADHTVPLPPRRERPDQTAQRAPDG